MQEGGGPGRGEEARSWGEDTAPKASCLSSSDLVSWWGARPLSPHPLRKRGHLASLIRVMGQARGQILRLPLRASNSLLWAKVVAPVKCRHMDHLHKGWLRVLKRGNPQSGAEPHDT